MLTNVPRTMRVALCLSHEFHTCHSEPRVGANADKLSLPGLTRQSIFFETNFCEDGWMPGSSPGMTSVFCVHTNLNFEQQACSKHNSAISPHVSREVWPARSALCNQRAQGMPGARCARSRVCRDSGREHTRSQVTPESPGIPYAMVYGLYRALPGDRLSCHRRRRSCLHRLDTSVGVSGPHVFAVRLKHPRQEHHPRPPHPHPALMTLRNAPLSGTGWRGI
jgi:hypothetical protein